MTVHPKMETLKQIADSILKKLKTVSDTEAERLMKMNDYHGFLKSRLPDDFLNEILFPFNLTPAEAQIELVKVDKDLSNELHFHADSSAYCVCLGEAYRVENPRGAKAFLKDTWFPVKAGDTLEFHPGTPHGFTIEPGGVLVFLSVQSPPIDQVDNDDYHHFDIKV